MKRAVPVVHVVIAHLRVPHRHARLLGHANAVQPMHRSRTVRPPRVPAGSKAAAPLRRNRRARRAVFRRSRPHPRAAVPAHPAPSRLRRNSSRSRFSRANCGLGLALQIFQKLERAAARVRHAVLQHQVGEIAKAQQLRLRAAQFQNAAQQRAIVMRAAGWRAPRRRDTSFAARAASSRYVITGV